MSRRLAGRHYRPALEDSKVLGGRKRPFGKCQRQSKPQIFSILSFRRATFPKPLNYPKPFPSDWQNVWHLSTVSGFIGASSRDSPGDELCKREERNQALPNPIFYISEWKRFSFPKIKTRRRRAASAAAVPPPPLPPPLSTGSRLAALMLLVPQLACRPRSRRIFRFVKSIKMPVMNIFLQLGVCFNMLFASGPNQALMCSAGGGVGKRRGGGGVSWIVSTVSSRDKTHLGVSATAD